jgi:hypothetical protein
MLYSSREPPAASNMKQQRQQQSLQLAGIGLILPHTYMPFVRLSPYGAPCIIITPMLVIACIITAHTLQLYSCPSAVLQFFLCMHLHGRPALAWHRQGTRDQLTSCVTWPLSHSCGHRSTELQCVPRFCWCCKAQYSMSGLKLGSLQDVMLGSTLYGMAGTVEP